jgi:hypothetical protein
MFITFLLLGIWWRRSQFGSIPPLESLPGDPPLQSIYGWERDRIVSAGKGLAATSAGFLATMVTTLVTKDVRFGISGETILGLVLGAVGLLLIGGLLGARSRSFIVERLG